MTPGDPNVARVEVVAEALGDLCQELVFVGGCAASLLIDAPSAPPTRVTYDVDVIAEVAALSGSRPGKAVCQARVCEGHVRRGAHLPLAGAGYRSGLDAHG